MTNQELDDLIGTKLEAFMDIDAIGESDLKEFTVKNWKRVGETFVLISEDGEIYSEDEINWHYSITPEAALWMVLMNTGIIPENFDSFDFDKYHIAFQAFMEKLEMLEIVTKSDGSKTKDDILN